MVVPYRHVPDYTDLTAEEVAELGAFTQTAMRVVRAVSGAHGFNIGMNQGLGRRRRHRRPPAPARRAALGRRHQLHAGHRADPGAAAGAARRPGRCWPAAVDRRAAVPARGGLSARPARPGPVVEKVMAPRSSAGWPGPGSPPTWSRSSARSARSPARSSCSAPGTCSGAPSSVTFSVLLDLLDGALARARGGGTVFGAVLDSAGDRAADAAIFGALVWWFSGARRQPAAGPARAALPGARRPDLLRQGARRGRRASPATSASSSASSGCSWCCSAPAWPGSACRTRCTSALWVLLAGSAVTVVQRFARRPARAAAGAALPAPPDRAVTGDRLRARLSRRGHRRRASPPAGTPSGCCRSPPPGARSTAPGAGRPAATARAPGSCGPTCGWSPADGWPSAELADAHHARRCAPTPGTGRRPSGCRR